DDIDLLFHPDGRSLNHARLASRQKPSSLVVTDDAGSRSITAPTVEFDLAPDGQTMTRLNANDPVTVDLPATKDAPARTIHAATLVAQGAAPGGLKSARFDRNVTFDEKGTGATAAAVARHAESAVLILDLNGQLDSIKQADFQQNVKFQNSDGAKG